MVNKSLSTNGLFCCMPSGLSYKYIQARTSYLRSNFYLKVWSFVNCTVAWVRTEYKSMCVCIYVCIYISMIARVWVCLHMWSVVICGWCMVPVREREWMCVCNLLVTQPSKHFTKPNKPIHTCAFKVYLLCWWTVFYDIPFMEDEGLKMTKLSVISFASSGIRPLRKSVTSLTVFRIRGCSICRLRWYINILYISFLHTNFF